MSKKVYLPNERGYLEQQPKTVKSYSKKDSVILPDPVTDPIVCNNIAWQEFDYTSNILKEPNDKETNTEETKNYK
ncbi:hypothetical protein [Clostridium niameyense]|uniref:hypothetical protein n=1 Tax=Clostridium niameyense TaxID=1622073 RepID=UPI00067EF211|nr:hypothetical protein [Clostridium niameyense]